MVYSNKYNESIQYRTHKTKSDMNFKKANQNFQKGGIIYNDYIVGTKKIGTKNYGIRSNLQVHDDKTPSDKLSSSNLSEDSIRENVILSSCNKENRTLQNLRSNLSNTNNDRVKINNATNDLNKCIDIFVDAYKHPDKRIQKIPTSNILPHNYPVKDTEIFGPNLDSCVDSQIYHNPYHVKLPNKITNNKPIYGTNRGFDVKGPRIMSKENINVNKQTPFDALNSGYNIQDNNKQYNITIENYDDHDDEMPVNSGDNPLTTPDIKIKNFCDNNKCYHSQYKYKTTIDIYNGKCGTKSKFGTVVDKLDQNPHVSEFVKHNIIGNNFENINRTSLYGKNKATFNNKMLEKSNLNLNQVRKLSHNNFIENTNKLRDEFNHNYFKQHTSKMQSNLDNRG